MSDEVRQYAVLISNLQTLIQEIENEKEADSPLFIHPRLGYYRSRARMLFEECLGDLATSHIKDINRVQELKPLSGVGFQLFATSLETVLNNKLRTVKNQHVLATQRQVIRGQLRPSALVTKATPIPVKQEELTPLSTKVFIVHGHDEAMKQHVARTLTQLNLNPVILHELPNKGRTVIEKFEEEAADVGFAVVLLSPDDEGRKVGDEDFHPRARQNVVLELGFFFGKLGRGRVVALYNDAKGFELPSDISGVIYIPYDRRGAWRMALCKELQECEYDVSADNLL